jgi:hypothetical protein
LITKEEFRAKQQIKRAPDITWMSGAPTQVRLNTEDIEELREWLREWEQFAEALERKIAATFSKIKLNATNHRRISECFSNAMQASMTHDLQSVRLLESLHQIEGSHEVLVDHLVDQVVQRDAKPSTEGREAVEAVEAAEAVEAVEAVEAIEENVKQDVAETPREPQHPTRSERRSNRNLTQVKSRVVERRRSPPVRKQGRSKRGPLAKLAGGVKSFGTEVAGGVVQSLPGETLDLVAHHGGMMAASQLGIDPALGSKLGKAAVVGVKTGPRGGLARGTHVMLRHYLTPKSHVAGQTDFHFHAHTLLVNVFVNAIERGINKAKFK